MTARHVVSIQSMLSRSARFVLWGLRADERGKVAKLPLSPYTGTVCDAHDPREHVTYELALTCIGRFDHAAGIGLVLREGDHLFAIDLDHCATKGIVRPEALEVIRAFPGAYVEWSQSGEGIHIIGSAAHAPAHRCKRAELGIELYTTGRYIALTGIGARGSMATDCTAPLHWFAAKYFAPSGPAADGSDDWTDTPVPEWQGPADDRQLIAQMLAARPSAEAAFGAKVTLAQLWAGDEQALARAYPSPQGDTYDRSSADAALMAHLAFWTGKNHARMWRIAKQSALYREKWERDDYRISTVVGAARKCTSVYGARSKSALPPAATGVEAADRGPLLRPLSELITRPRRQEWQVKGVLEFGVLAMLLGEPETGKSFVAFDLAACIASGVEWHGRRIRQGPVVYVMGEGHGGFARRAKAWEVHHSMSLTAAPIFYSRAAVRFFVPGDVAALVSELDALPVRPAMITIDTLARAFMGGDENSAEDAGRFIAECDMLRERYQCTVVVVHHTGKNNGGRARGSGAFFGAVDAELVATRTDDVIVLACGKMKDGPRFPAMPFTFFDIRLPPDWLDDEGNVQSSAVLKPCSMPAPKDKALKPQRLGSKQEEVLVMFEAMIDRNPDGVSYADLREAMRVEKVSRNRCWEAVKGLAARGEIVVKGDLKAGDATLFPGEGRPDPSATP